MARPRIYCHDVRCPFCGSNWMSRHGDSKCRQVTAGLPGTATYGGTSRTAAGRSDCLRRAVDLLRRRSFASAARPPFDPPADGRRGYAKAAGQGAQRTAFLVHGQGQFLDGGAGPGAGGIGDVVASAVAAAIDLAAFGSAVLGHPVGAAGRAADVVAVSGRAGHGGPSDRG